MHGACSRDSRPEVAGEFAQDETLAATCSKSLLLSTPDCPVLHVPRVDADMQPVLWCRGLRKAHDNT